MLVPMTLEDKGKKIEEVLSYPCVQLLCNNASGTTGCFVLVLLSLSYTPGPSFGPELSGVFLTVKPQASCPATEKGPFD